MCNPILRKHVQRKKDTHTYTVHRDCPCTNVCCTLASRALLTTLRHPDFCATGKRPCPPLCRAGENKDTAGVTAPWRREKSGMRSLVDKNIIHFQYLTYYAKPGGTLDHEDRCSTHTNTRHSLLVSLHSSACRVPSTLANKERGVLEQKEDTSHRQALAPRNP